MILCVGLATVDLVYRVARMPGPDEKAQATSVEVAAGGPAANAAVTIAALGTPVTLVTAIGAHPLGALVRSNLEDRGVRLVDAAAGTEALPPVSTVVVDESTGERTIVSRNAADVTHAVPEEGLPEAALTLVDGHHPALASAAARTAGRLVVDAGSWRPVFADIFPYAEVVACSAAFRHPAAPDGPDAATAAAIGAPHVVVTHGAAPVTWFSRSGGAGSIAVPPVEAVDTAGAGDAFHGALAAALAAGSPLDAAVTEAVRVAGVRVQHPGPRSWLEHLGPL
ncbi:PfkB family carbohydrate kinase [Actinoplanes sp. URMC 104]|uniref:PfkB family carbohydrate kinase n=1 Tax=Actinoplanes sp. URMC 104 TaxID=3423409 RepID=UPI003F1B297F